MTRLGLALKLAAAVNAAILLPVRPPPSSGAAVSLHEAGAPGAYHLEGSFSVDADADAIWDVLTDYDGIAGFVSSVRSSRVVGRTAGGKLVEQEGSGRFLFFSRRARLLLDVEEERPSRIVFNDVGSSDFLYYRGSWTIRSVEGCSVVEYELTARPDPAFAPPFAAKRALKRNARKLLDELRLEIERRHPPGSFRQPPDAGRNLP